MRQDFAYLPEDSQINPILMRTMGAFAILGCVVLFGTTIAAAIVVDDKSWLANTISDLAAGRWEEIQDAGIYAFVGATAAAAVGAGNLHPGRLGWTLGIIAMVLAIPCMVVIGAREAYSPGVEGLAVHIYAVVGMGAAMTIGPLLMSVGAGRLHPYYRTAFIVSGLGFGILIPVFFFWVPTSFDGLVERIMGLFAMLWIGGLGMMFWRAGQEIEQRYHR